MCLVVHFHSSAVSHKELSRSPGTTFPAPCLLRVPWVACAWGLDHWGGGQSLGWPGDSACLARPGEQVGAAVPDSAYIGLSLPSARQALLSC